MELRDDMTAKEYEEKMKDKYNCPRCESSDIEKESAWIPVYRSRGELLDEPPCDVINLGTEICICRDCHLMFMVFSGKGVKLQSFFDDDEIDEDKFPFEWKGSQERDTDG